jgi:DNA-binding Lrp family transcriptional regulator
MSVSAYVLIQTEMDKAAAVAEAIKDIPGVVSVDVVTGPYDVIAKTSADTMDELGKMVVSKVQKVPGINRTLTSPVVNL